jgi:hypothetical protein
MLLKPNLITYIDHLQKQNADDLAFYPITTLEKAIEDHRVITCEDNDETAGYIWHGPVRPGYDTIIYQACVDYDSRRRHLGWDMVGNLIGMCRAGSATGIRLRCASSSESNEFWQLIGFYCTNVKAGGVKRSRDINHWRTDIQPTLFTLPPVVPSTKPIDLSSYGRKKRAGVAMPNPWSRTHY